MTRRATPAPSRATAARRVAADELLTELDLFRASFQQVAVNYQRRVEADVVAIHAACRRLLDSGELSPRHTTDMRAMLSALRQLDIRPLKGRRKDLRAMDELIGRLVQLIDTW